MFCCDVSVRCHVASIRTTSHLMWERAESAVGALKLLIRFIKGAMKFPFGLFFDPGVRGPIGKHKC